MNKPEPKLEDMTLRDLMAMFAMQLVLGKTPEQAARNAYLAADAMLKERSKQ